MTDDDLDRVRDALRAEAAGVEASESLLARISAATGDEVVLQPPAPPSPTRRLVATIAAAVVVAAALGGIDELQRDEDDRIATLGLDDVTSTAQTTMTPNAGISTTALEPTRLPGAGLPGTTVPEREDYPPLIALVREDGWLVARSPHTDEERLLANYGDPDVVFDEGHYSLYIDDIDVSPDGRWVYFSTCCEPAFGETYRVDLAGSAGPFDFSRGSFMGGSMPRVSPDGSYLATMAGTTLVVRDVRVDFQQPASLDLLDPSEQMDSLWPTDMAWSPDGTRITVVLTDTQDPSRRTVRYVEMGETEMTESPPGISEDTRRFPLFTRGAVGPLFRDEADFEGVRGVRQDASYSWLLWLDQDGVLSASRTLGQDREVIPGMPPARVADW